MKETRINRPLKDRIKRAIYRMKAIAFRRRSLVNDLNFTYQRLARLLPALIRRLHADELIDTLRNQYDEGLLIHARLVDLVTAHGEAPQPCLCEEANAVVEEVYHADRRAARTDAHDAAILGALRTTRRFLIGHWTKLLDTISPEAMPEYRNEVRKLQHREGELHRALVRLEQRFRPEG